MRWPLRVDFRAWLIGLVISALVLLTCYEYVCSYRDALMIIIGKRSGWTRVRRCASALTSLQLPSTPLLTGTSQLMHVPGAVQAPALPRRHRPPASFHARAFPARTVTHARDTPVRPPHSAGGTLPRRARAGQPSGRGQARRGARGSAGRSVQTLRSVIPPKIPML